MTPNPSNNENKVAISDQSVEIVKNYIRTHKQWAVDAYDIDPNPKTTADGNLLVTVVHHDDLKVDRPGGGKSIQLAIDVKQGLVVREFAFQ